MKSKKRDEAWSKIENLATKNVPTDENEFFGSQTINQSDIPALDEGGDVDGFNGNNIETGNSEIDTSRKKMGLLG